MDHKVAIILLLSLTFPEWTSQQSWGDKSLVNDRYGNNGPPATKEPSNWKTIMVVVFGVIFFAAAIYGSNCYHICKMHFFERTEKKYMKMNNSYANIDSCSHV